MGMINSIYWTFDEKISVARRFKKIKNKFPTAPRMFLVREAQKILPKDRQRTSNGSIYKTYKETCKIAEQVRAEPMTPEENRLAREAEDETRGTIAVKTSILTTASNEALIGELRKRLNRL